MTYFILNCDFTIVYYCIVYLKHIIMINSCE